MQICEKSRQLFLAIVLASCPFTLANNEENVKFPTSNGKNGTNGGGGQVKVLIVGAGMAGLSCARYLANHSNFDVLVVEANPERYGGRIWTYEVPNFPGKPVELGAMWLHNGLDPSHPLHLIAKSNNLDLLEHDALDFSAIQTFDLLGEPYTNETKQEMETIIKLLYSNRNDLVTKNRSDISVDDAIKILSRENSRLFQQNRVKFLEIPGIESLYGSTIDQLSLMYSKGIPNDRNAIEFNGNDAVLPKGYKKLLDYFLNMGKKFELQLGRRVIRIDYRNDSASSRGNMKKAIVTAVDAKLNETHVYKVDHVILAVPLGVLKAGNITFEPPLTLDHTRAIENIGFGNMVKVLLVYDKVFWPNETFFCFESSNPIGLPLLVANLHKIHQLPALLTYIASHGAVAADNMAESEIIKRVYGHFESAFGIKNVRERKLIHTKVTRWRNDSLIGGAYSFGKIGMKTSDAYNIRAAIKPHLFFAGEHTAMPENLHARVHGAYFSGIRAAKEIMVLRRHSDTN